MAVGWSVLNNDFSRRFASKFPVIDFDNLFSFGFVKIKEERREQKKINEGRKCETKEGGAARLKLLYFTSFQLSNFRKNASL